MAFNEAIVSADQRGLGYQIYFSRYYPEYAYLAHIIEAIDALSHEPAMYTARIIYCSLELV